MPAVSRNRIDLAATGHACTTKIGVQASQFTVFSNGSAVLRRGDRLLPHTILVCCPARCVRHNAKVNRGSPNVFIQGRPVARKRDSADRGRMIQAHPTCSRTEDRMAVNKDYDHWQKHHPTSATRHWRTPSTSSR
jgi:uncharacterized Zn-binding protein involved in type VI secretion